jgi:hypothetical protein
MIPILLFAFLLMSPEETKKTGLNKLSSKEKKELQHWVDNNYDKKPQPGTKKVKGANPTLSENLMNSQYLRLSDDTLWNIRPEDVPIAQGWITPAEIVVTTSGNPFFSYKLTNQLSGSSVLARKADKLPPPGSPNLAPSGDSIETKPTPSKK